MGKGEIRMAEAQLRKTVPIASYGWNNEKKCVELEMLINDEIHVMPIYQKDIKGMEQWFWIDELKKQNLIK
ncbi:hypothetical protein bcere0016_4850 [Bacillus cereus 95/8201]|nr:hypothetical protein bcere0016_4850 [Bacillus cereus 95/8201]